MVAKAAAVAEAEYDRAIIVKQTEPPVRQTGGFFFDLIKGSAMF